MNWTCVRKSERPTDQHYNRAAYPIKFPHVNVGFTHSHVLYPSPSPCLGKNGFSTWKKPGTVLTKYFEWISYRSELWNDFKLWLYVLTHERHLCMNEYNGHGRTQRVLTLPFNNLVWLCVSHFWYCLFFPSFFCKLTVISLWFHLFSFFVLSFPFSFIVD